MICKLCGTVASPPAEHLHRCPRFPVTIEVETTHAVVTRLTELRDTGLYGATREAVAEELLRRAIRDLDRAG